MKPFAPVTRTQAPAGADAVIVCTPPGRHRVDAERADHCCSVVGNLLQAECLPTAQATTVPVVIDANHRVALHQRFIGIEELRVGTRRPSMEQQHRGCARIVVTVVTDEDLSLVTGRIGDFGGERERGDEQGNSV